MTERIRAGSLIFVCLALALASLVYAGDGVMFGYSYKEGYSQSYKVTFSQEVDFGGFAQSQIVDLEVTEECVGVEDGKFLMRMVFNKVESSVMIMNQMQDNNAVSALTGQALRFKVDSHGEVEDIAPEGYIDGWQELSRTVKPLVDGWFPYLPGKEIAVGEGWTRSQTDTTSGMITSADASYTYQEKKKQDGRECARVGSSAKSKIGGTINTQIGAMKAEGGGKSDVEFYFDAESMTLVRVKFSGETRLDMTADNGNVTETTINIQVERKLN